MGFVNLTSRRRRVFIGADQQDWSLAAGQFLTNQESLGESGLLPIDAQLEILPVLETPESIDPAENPVRWRPGQPVLIEVQNDSGAWVTHPQGRLFLLEEPDLPEDGGGLLLSLGCRLAWHNSFEFDNDATGVEVGTATNSAVVAQRLLEANEIPGGAISLGSWPFDVLIPEGKGRNASFIGQAGALAYSNAWRYLWQQPSGMITASALDLAASAPLITITLGENDVRYRRIKVEATPPEILKVAGIGVVVTEDENPSTEISEVEGDRTQFEEGTVSCPGTGVISRSTTVTSWSENDGILTYTIATALEAPRSAVAVRPGLVSGPCSLINWKTIDVVKRFDLSQGGRLIDTVTTERQRRFTFTARVTPRLTFATTKVTTETPTYSDDLITRLRVEEQQALGILDSQSADPLDLIDTRETDTRWVQKGNATWQKVESAKIPRALTNSSPQASPTAAIGNTTTSTSGTGSNQPPRAEFWDRGIITQDVEYQGIATYTLPGGATGRTRKALRAVPFAFSDAQCQALAVAHVGLMAGRHRAALIEFEISDTLLSAPPLFRCDVVMPSGERRQYRIDGLAWEHTATESKAVGTGILVGTIPA